MKNYYRMEINFNSISVTVKAKNKTEARAKAMLKLEKKNIKTLIDKQNTWVEERTYY